MAARELTQSADRQRKRVRKFVQKTFSLGAPKNFRWEKILALADAMEDEAMIRKLSLTK